MINECMIISSAMRKMTRWSQSGVAAILGGGDLFSNDDDSLAHNLGLGSSGSNNNPGNHRQITHNPLLSSFLQLRSILMDANDLYEIDSLTLLQPFLLVIKSSSTTGNITSLALTSITKFLNYGIISHRSKNLKITIIQIISSLTHCRFEAADQNSDDAVLLKVLRLLESLIESPLSNLLPNEVISEVVQTCLSLACNKKRSEVLRKAAEMAMVSITVRIFKQLKEIEPENDKLEDLQTKFQETQLPEDLIGGTDLKPSNVVKVDKSDSDTNDTEEPFGILCINEFLGILISMISPSNQYQHMESTRVFALSLINTAIEVSGLEVLNHPSLLALVSDPISRHILQIITTTDSPALLSAALQLFSTVAIVLGRQLRPQFELTLSLIFKSILPDGDKPNQNQKDVNTANVSRRNAASKEMLIESLSLLWTRSPVFFTHLFIDYDCNFDNSDLSTKVLQSLCIFSLPESAINTTDNVPPICLEGILSFISGINDRIKSIGIGNGIANGNGNDINELPLPELIKDRTKKTTFIKCTELLNEKPKKGLKALQDGGFIKSSEDAEEIAKFFFTKAGRLNKKVLGEFLAKPDNIELLKHFMNLFDFDGLRVDEALRLLLKSFRLPGEAQQIERVVETFAEKYANSNNGTSIDGEEEIVKPDRDSVFILSYSIILLNTDLHNPQVKKQMILDDYKRNLRGVYNGKDFPEWYLSKIYNSIKDREIIMPEEHHGTDKWFDDVWHNLVSSQVNSTHNPANLSWIEICQFDKVLFESIVDTLIDTLIQVFKEASDDHVITRLMSSIDKCANICLYYNLTNPIDKLIDLLADLTGLTTKKYRILNQDDNLRDEIPITQIKIEKKEEAITVSEMAVWFGRDFKAQLSTVVLFRLIKKIDGKVSNAWNKIIRIILTLFENCLINPNLFNDFQSKIHLAPLAKVKPRYIIKRVKPLNNSGILSTFSSFLKGYSDEPPEPSDQEIESTLSTIDCVKSIKIANVFEMVSRGSSTDLIKFIEILLDSLPEYKEETKRYYESETLFLLEISVCFCLLLKDQTIISQVIKRLNPLEISKKNQLRLITYKLLLTRLSDESCNINDTIKELMEFDKEVLNKQGGQVLQPLFSLVDDDSWCCKQLLNDESYWKLLRFFGSFQVYAPELLEFQEGIIKSSNHELNPNNYMLFLGLLDEISSLGAIGSQYEQENASLGSEADSLYFKDIVEVSKRSITLTTELSDILNHNEFKGKDLSYSLIQALAHQCFNPCREVRSFALNSLQTTVLSFELSNESSAFGIFEYGLFPLLSELSKVEVLQTDIHGFSKTQVETLTLISKVFLNYCDQFNDEETERVWLGILDHFITFDNLGGKHKVEQSFKESGSELLKNMILVLQTNGVLVEDSSIWNASWDKIDTLYPQLRAELEPRGHTEPVEPVEPEPVVEVGEGVVGEPVAEVSESSA
ncbi:GDP/GTP exchange factor for ARF [Scheffersomyces amazonensis]|uniref:GDP/GTP exchange factor for ARF n=1 Tax=Scheffersomyces amazonensis TaxID=1078765 RepID=UPI00315DBAEB